MARSAGLVGIAAALILLTGCPAIEPYAHVDSAGYEAGVRGTWTGVAQETAQALGVNVADGKEVVK